MVWLVVTGTWLDYFFHILGMSSSQLTNSYFSEGWLNHQPVMIIASTFEQHVTNMLVKIPYSTMVPGRCLFTKWEGINYEIYPDVVLVHISTHTWYFRCRISIYIFINGNWAIDNPCEELSLRWVTILISDILIYNVYKYVYICIYVSTCAEWGNDPIHKYVHNPPFPQFLMKETPENW